MILLGSTGSIGLNTLEICRRYQLPIEGLVAGNNLERLQEQIDEFQPELVAIADPARIGEIRHPRVYAGPEGILRLLEESTSPRVVNALVGYAGLAPTLKTLELGRRLALANKESLVVAGAFLDRTKIFPIDSEHFGLWYLQNGRPIERLILTASGGAFRDRNPERIRSADYAEALRHPNWSMGDKITIDSASMANKLFELLEARWLFDTPHVDAVIERNSVVHALVEFRDGSTTAHLADVDMKLPIAYALECPVTEPVLDPVDLLGIGPIAFEEIDTERYPLWQLKAELLAHPRLGVVLNAANEAAMAGFREGRYDFGTMSDKILDAWRHFRDREPQSLAEVMEMDRQVREYVFANVE
ncbi:1-deoxy-D-xylulose-5-phosphate reductoisomerase [Nitratifractor sp.]|uniref:1-deoxy-D-xylulose-5-phosphate reductoisomerase n=1 Tax=Nitratifractor sp. TaxID=2268144 RepID=UPI0025FDDCA1|nr:1-deoxy-D-xylulose-5-phosphate reductoisomerase [Nitratifractor sp.]